MSRSCTAINSYSPAPAPPPVITDRMVETDFEAAEVLASLSKSTPPPPSSREGSIGGGGGACESVDSWESRTKRSSDVRVKSESSLVDSALNSVSASIVEEKKPVLLAFDLNEDQATTFNQEEECRQESKYVVKAEEVELAEPGPVCTASHTGVKSRQNLSEAEKEARRLRRVLANRESARQTIRRRQALYEELTRKVADLARENESLKKEKESALEDYQALKCTNKNLNEQVAEQLGSKLEENAGKSTSSNCSIPSLPFANYPYIIYKDTPFVYPYNIQLPDMNPPHLLGHFNVVHQPEAKMSETTNSESGKANPLSIINGPNGHWCMVPYPLFIPMPDAMDAPNLIPFFPSGVKETKTTDRINAKTESKEAHEIPFGLSLDVVDEKLVCQSKQGVESSSKQGCMSQSDAREAMGLKMTNGEIIMSSKGNIHDKESQQEQSVSHGKRLVDPTLTAEARKKRKELKKMKGLHCRAHRKEGLRFAYLVVLST
ncbi:hypothetical protein V2J09_009663 [Rumex salicifolius]